jgi:hypothetical protein
MAAYQAPEVQARRQSTQQTSRPKAKHLTITRGSPSIYASYTYLILVGLCALSIVLKAHRTCYDKIHYHSFKCSFFGSS